MFLVYMCVQASPSRINLQVPVWLYLKSKIMFQVVSMVYSIIIQVFEKSN